MKYIDIHSHLDSEEYDADRTEVLARMKEKEVGTITIGATLEESQKAVEIAEQNEDVWACIGIHPENITSPLTPLLDAGGGKHISHSDNSGIPLPSPASRGRVGDEVKKLEELVRHPKVVAIGECGLDYFRLKDESEKEKQKDLFEQQIQFAIKHSKPLMLHIRDAYGDALEILKNYEGVRGNVHFFAGDIAIAKKFLDLGFTLSFTGVITFTHDYDEVIKYIPQSSIMSETDAPFVAPVPHRGKRNEPAYVIEVIKKMAEIRREKFEDFNNAIMENAKRTFAF